jgi:phosphatidylglycerophosphatase A
MTAADNITAGRRPTMPLSHPAKFIGTWFGVGLSPKAPGTMGSIAALPFAYVIQTHWGNMGLFLHCRLRGL